MSVTKATKMMRSNPPVLATACAPSVKLAINSMGNNNIPYRLCLLGQGQDFCSMQGGLKSEGIVNHVHQRFSI